MNGSGHETQGEQPDGAALLRAVARGDEDALGTRYDRHAGWPSRLSGTCLSPPDSW